MSKQAIIGINGSLSPFSETVDKLSSPGIGGSSITWVPEDQTRCEALRVTANGTYAAASAGKYGYNYVTVSVAGDSVTGKDDDGDEATATPDPDTGVIEYTKIPSRIEVVTPPTKTNYTHGETIDYTGIVVKAYYETSGEWGTVPYNELVFPVNTADAGTSEQWSDGEGLNATLITYRPTWTRVINNHGVETEEQVFVHTTAIGTDNYGNPASLGGTEPASLLVTKYNGKLYAALIAGDARFDLKAHFNGTSERWPDAQVYGWRGVGSSTYRTSINAFTMAVWEQYITDIPESTVDPTTVTPSNVHAVQSLPVNWPRPGDGAILETSFDITVTSASQEG